MVRQTRGGYSLYLAFDGTPIARLRPTGQDDEVEVLWWSHRERWEPVAALRATIDCLLS